MAKFMILVYLDGIPNERHVVNTPSPGEGDFYRQAVSLDCFKTRENKRTYHNHMKGISKIKGKLSHVNWYDEYITTVDVTREFSNKTGIDINHPFDSTLEHTHDSIWKFYKAVGYDYKKKRYV